MMKNNVVPVGLFVIFISMSMSGCSQKPSPIDEATGYYNRAHSCFVKNEPDKAIRLYQKAIKKRINFAQAYHELAVCFQQVGQDQKAIDNYEAAIVFNPKDVDAYQSIANIYFMKADYDNALIYYDRASEVDYLYARSYQNIATIWYMRADYEMAKKYFNQAIAVDTTYPRAYYGLGLMAYILGDTIEAETKMQDAVRVGDLPEAIYMLGQIFYDKSDFADAKNWLNRYIEKEPSGQWAEKSKSMILICEQRINSNR